MSMDSKTDLTDQSLEVRAGAVAALLRKASGGKLNAEKVARLIAADLCAVRDASERTSPATRLWYAMETARDVGEPLAAVGLERAYRARYGSYPPWTSEAQAVDDAEAKA